MNRFLVKASVSAAFILSLLTLSPAAALTPPPGHFAYVVNWAGSSVSVVDTDAWVVTATIPVGGEPSGVAVGAGGYNVYVTNRTDQTISVIDTVSNAVWATIPTGGGGPGALAVNSTETTAYVIDGPSHSVQVLDLFSQTVTATIPMGRLCSYIAVDPSNRYVYVSGGDGLSIVDTRYKSIIATIAVGTSLAGVAVHPSGASVFVCDYGEGAVAVVNPYTYSFSKIPVGSGPTSVVFNRSGTYAFVTNSLSDTVSVIKTATGTVVATIPVGDYPYNIDVDRSDRYLYTMNTLDNTVSVVDWKAQYVAATVPVGANPSGAGRFISTSTLWTAPLSASLRVTSLEEDKSGNVKFKTTTKAIQGTCYMTATYRRPTALSCYALDGTYFMLENLSHLGTEMPKMKTEQVMVNGSGPGAILLPPDRYYPGFSMFEAKGTMKKDASGQVMSVIITGKATIHADTGVIGTGNLRLEFSRQQ